jgi:2-amino-4-hydroxy-6-hydroxymethyldihydropteridine diphosphokinase/dihydropteroate synthase
MTAILGLGSNLGDRREMLERALGELPRHGISIVRVSPVVESPALLPDDAPVDWNRPFLNLAAEVTTRATPTDLLAALKSIEASLGRTGGPRWAPRPVDIDILMVDDIEVDSAHLTVPHPGLTDRAFVLAPLAAIAPARVIPGTKGLTVLAAYRRLGQPLPLWMGIVNLTPDSFSDGGTHDDWSSVAATIERMTAASAALIDFGAESTRPGASPLTAGEEWRRLEPTLERVLDTFAGRALRPAISVDTYHPEVAGRAIELGVDVINDVGGLTDPAMLELAASSEGDWIAMHQLSLPANPAMTLPPGRNAVDQIAEWLDGRHEAWAAAGLASDRIVFDPGIGFGKSPLQSLELLRGIERFIRDDLRVLVGHSRKSFLRPIGGESPGDRDLVTIGASLELAQRGVDILRVHNVADHVTAWSGFAHARAG